MIKKYFLLVVVSFCALHASHFLKSFTASIKKKPIEYAIGTALFANTFITWYKKKYTKDSVTNKTYVETLEEEKNLLLKKPTEEEINSLTEDQKTKYNTFWDFFGDNKAAKLFKKQGLIPTYIMYKFKFDQILSDLNKETITVSLDDKQEKSLTIMQVFRAEYDNDKTHNKNKTFLEWFFSPKYVSEYSKLSFDGKKIIMKEKTIEVLNEKVQAISLFITECFKYFQNSNRNLTYKYTKSSGKIFNIFHSQESIEEVMLEDDFYKIYSDYFKYFAWLENEIFHAKHPSLRILKNTLIFSTLLLAFNKYLK